MRDRTARTEAQLRQRLHCQAERADASASVGGHAEEDKAELDAEPDDSTGKDKADKSQRFKRASGLFRKDRLARPFRSQDSSLSSRDSDVGAAFPAAPGASTFSLPSPMGEQRRVALPRGKLGVMFEAVPGGGAHVRAVRAGSAVRGALLPGDRPVRLNELALDCAGAAEIVAALAEREDEDRELVVLRPPAGAVELGSVSVEVDLEPPAEGDI